MLTVAGPRGVDLDAIFTSLADIEYRQWIMMNRDRAAISKGQVMLFAPTLGMPNANDGTSAQNRFREYRIHRPGKPKTQSPE